MNISSNISKATLDAIINVDSEVTWNAISSVITLETWNKTRNATHDAISVVVDAKNRRKIIDTTWHKIASITTTYRASDDAIVMATSEILKRINP